MADAAQIAGTDKAMSERQELIGRLLPIEQRHRDTLGAMLDTVLVTPLDQLLALGLTRDLNNGQAAALLAVATLTAELDKMREQLVRDRPEGNG